MAHSKRIEKTMSSSKDERLALRVPSEMRAILEERAEEDHRTLSGLVLKILDEWIHQPKIRRTARAR